ncbi:MAG TPA: carboxypeptidase-like regulatory domain-containing protein [Terriglobales bacterium]|jgi:hypothetical protein|nr:carboxypeptidase-like regulatory domain-containing protein [Terriglobales bacterium]
MSDQIKFALLFSMAFACQTGFATTDTTPSIAGIVIAPDGAAVPKAAVEAVRLPGARDDLTANQLQWIQTDNEGRFQLTLTRGRYEIRGKDENDGYPDPNFLLSSDTHSLFPVVAIDSTDLTDVKVKLGPKGGILEGELLDQATRSPVEKGKVTIADAQNPKIFRDFRRQTGALPICSTQ